MIFQETMAALFLGALQSRIPVESFALLGLGPDATERDVIKSFREKSMEVHPDRGGNSEDFVKVLEAKDKCLAYLERKQK